MQVHASGTRMAFAAAAACQSLHSCCRPCFHPTSTEFNLHPQLLPFRVAPRVTPSLSLCHRSTQQGAGTTLLPLFLRMLDDEGGTIRLSELLLLLLRCEGGASRHTRP